MQMSTRHEGDFTTNLSVVVQILKRQDLRPISSNPTTLRLSPAKVTSRRQLDNIMFVRHNDKIAASGEGHKPELDRQKYMVESEFALLSILYR